MLNLVQHLFGSPAVMLNSFQHLIASPRVMLNLVQHPETLKQVQGDGVDVLQCADDHDARTTRTSATGSRLPSSSREWTAITSHPS